MHFLASSITNLQFIDLDQPPLLLSGCASISVPSCHIRETQASSRLTEINRFLSFFHDRHSINMSFSNFLRGTLHFPMIGFHWLFSTFLGNLMNSAGRMGRTILIVKTLKIHARTIPSICSRPPLIVEVPIICDFKYSLLNIPVCPVRVAAIALLLLPFLRK